MAWTARQLVGGSRVDPVGEASYQAALEMIAGGKHHDQAHLDVTAVLIPEPDNPYDANAVCVRVDNECVAYLCRADAIAYQSNLLELWRREIYCWCKATIMGGWLRDDGDEGHFGIWLDLAAPEKAFGQEQVTTAPTPAADRTTRTIGQLLALALFAPRVTDAIRDELLDKTGRRPDVVEVIDLLQDEVLRPEILT